MSALADIAATYRGPGGVVRALISRGPREDRALAILMGACAIIFVAQWPRLAREAHLSGTELNPLLGGALLAWIIIAPLALYIIAALSRAPARLAGLRVSGYGARIALFWALFATSPLILLYGLVAGFIGTGVQETLIGIIWLAVFLWFWIAGLVAAGREGRT